DIQGNLRLTNRFSSNAGMETVRGMQSLQPAPLTPSPPAPPQRPSPRPHHRTPWAKTGAVPRRPPGSVPVSQNDLAPNDHRRALMIGAAVNQVEGDLDQGEGRRGERFTGRGEQVDRAGSSPTPVVGLGRRMSAGLGSATGPEHAPFR